jgi:hypothetical protein
MELKLVRSEFTEKSTIGELFVNNKFECFTLEDKVRPLKVMGVTAIPAGEYEVIISFSNRFQRPLPLLLKVPDFEGIRIHPGNTDKDTQGCILVGQIKGKDFLGQSRDAFNALFKKLQAVTKKEKILIRITQDPLQVSLASSVEVPSPSVG